MEWSPDGKPERMFGTHSDISTLKQAEFALVDALDEKQTLLRELQHRIKNSMAMITSLVYLEADRNTDKNVRTALEDIGGRVSVLADLYGLLYEREGIKSSSIGISRRSAILFPRLFQRTGRFSFLPL
jgi:two-component sensor histidine kinase